MIKRDSRSPLARAIGLGSSKRGADHWWAERLSSIALVPLTIWLLIGLILHSASDYAGFIQWLRMPASAILMILLLVALFHHTALGLQVIIEDYVHSGLKFAALASMRLFCFGMAIAGVVAVLLIALGP